MFPTIEEYLDDLFRQRTEGHPVIGIEPSQVSLVHHGYIIRCTNCGNLFSTGTASLGTCTSCDEQWWTGATNGVLLSFPKHTHRHALSEYDQIRSAVRELGIPVAELPQPRYLKGQMIAFRYQTALLEGTIQRIVLDICTKPAQRKPGPSTYFLVTYYVHTPNRFYVAEETAILSTP